jgi:methylglutaconyl-CoA hydratase
MQQFIKTEFENGVGRISLNRPDKRNALNREMLDQFCQSVDELNSRDELRVLVLQAVGSVFCAGMDLAQMRERATDPNRDQLWREDSESYHKALLALLNCRFPTIAAVPGPAIAGGVGLVLACDIVIASDAAFFALPEPRRGIVAAMVTPLLLRRTSQARARYVVLSGKKIPAEEAFVIGLCDEVVRQSECESAIEETLQSVLESSPQALATTKRFLDSIGVSDLREALNRAIQVSADARASADAREGLDAFLEKRKPAWTQIASRTR